jgi:hypothetical protein
VAIILGRKPHTLNSAVSKTLDIIILIMAPLSKGQMEINKRKILSN